MTDYIWDILKYIASTVPKENKIVYDNLELSVRTDKITDANIKVTLIPVSYKFDTKIYNEQQLCEILPEPIEFFLPFENNASTMCEEEITTLVFSLKNQIRCQYSYLRSIFEKALVLLQRIKEYPDEHVQNAARILLTTKYG